MTFSLIQGLTHTLIGQIHNDQSENKILSFGSLPEGWNYGNGIPPQKRIIDMAINLNTFALLLGFQTDAFPGTDGEIQISCYNKDDCLEFIIENSEKISFVFEENDNQKKYNENISFNEVLGELIKYSKENICNTLDYSSVNIMIESESDSSVWLLETPLMGVEYQFSL